MSDISIKMKLDGESDFRRAVKDCNSELKNMQSELKKVDAESQGQANSLDALEKKYEALTKVQESAAKKTEALSEIVEKATAKRDAAADALEKLKSSEEASREEIEKAERAYQNAETGLNNWQTQLNKAETEEIKLNQELQQTGTYLEEARSSADDCATSIDEYGKKTKEAIDNTDGLLNSVSNLGAMEALSKLADTVSEKFTKIGDAAKAAMYELDAGFDIIITKTGASGDALEDLQRSAENVFAIMPTDIETVGTAIGEVNTRFGVTGALLEYLTEKFVEFAEINGTDVNSAIDTVDRILTQYGGSISDISGLLGQLTKRSQETGKETGALMNEIDANASLLKTFGLSLEESVNLFARFEDNGISASTALSGMRKAAAKYSKEGDDMRAGLEKTVDAIKNATTDTEAYAIAQETFGNRGFTAMADAIRDGRFALDDLGDSFSNYTTIVEETYNETKNAWDEWTVATNNLKIAGGELSAEFYEGMTPAIEGLTTFVQDATTAFQNLPEPMQDVLGVAGGLTIEVGKLAPQLLAASSQLATLSVNAPKLLTTLKGMAGPIKGLKTALAGLGDPVVLASIGGVAAGILVAKNALEDLGKSVDEIVAEVQAGASEAASEIDLYRVSVQNAGTAQDKFANATEAYAKAQSNTKKATEDLNKIQDKQNSLLEDTRKEVDETNSGWATFAKLLAANTGVGAEGVLVLAEYSESTEKLKGATEAANESVTMATDAEREFIGQMGEAVSAMEADNDMTRGVTDGTIELAEAYGYANGTAGEAIEALGNLSLAHQQTREQIQGEIDAINTKMQELQAEYDAAYESAYNSLSGQFGLFQQITMDAIPNIDEMTAALDSQMEFMVNYATNMQKAAEMGISDGLLKELSDGSIESAQYLQAIVDGGEEKVGELNRAWEKTENGRKAFAKVLAEQQTDFNNRMSALESRMNTAVNNLNKADAAYISGAQTIQGYIRGSEAYRGAIIAEYTSLGNAATQAFNAAVKIKSPSKVFYESGVYTMEGAIQGAESMRDNLMDTYESLALASIAAFNPAAYRSDIGRYTGSQNINNQVAVYIGDKELTGIMAQGVIKNISAQQRNGYAGIRR